MNLFACFDRFVRKDSLRAQDKPLEYPDAKALFAVLQQLLETGGANCAERGGVLGYTIRGTDADGHPTVWLVEIQDCGPDNFDLEDNNLWGLDGA